MRNNGLLKSRVVRSLIAAIIVLAAAVSVAHAQTTVTVTWDSNTDPYTAGYRLYYGTASGSYQWSVDAGTLTSGPLTLSPGYIYYFAVRAYNSSYEYGPPSNEATLDLRSATAPAPTAQISATLSGPTTALVSWQTTNAVSSSINGIAVGSSGSASVTVDTTTTFTIVAVGSDGRTATASSTVTVTTTHGTPPAAPAALSSSTAGSRVTLSWSPPASGGTPDRYVIYVGTSSGGSQVSNGYVVGNVLTVTGELPRGRYYARVRAANAAGMSGDSNEVQFRIGRQLRTPSGFQVTWEGSVAVFSWSPWTADAPREDEPTGYVLEAGTRPGASDVATINVGNVTSFRATVPGGRFYVRLRAVNALGNSDPTPDLEVSPPGAPAAPGAPTSLADVGSGPTVDLRWTAPVGGGPPTGYVIEVGSAPGLSNLVTLPVGNITRFVTSAPPGVYYVRVRAVNAQGPGGASNEITIRR